MTLVTIAGFFSGVWRAIKSAGRWVQEPGSWKAILVACALASVAYGVVKVRTQRAEIIALSEAVRASEEQIKDRDAQIELLTAASEANTRAISSRNEMLEIIEQQTEKERAESIAILKQNEGWSNEPIPPALLDRLRAAH